MAKNKIETGIVHTSNEGLPFSTDLPDGKCLTKILKKTTPNMKFKDFYFYIDLDGMIQVPLLCYSDKGGYYYFDSMCRIDENTHHFIYCRNGDKNACVIFQSKSQLPPKIKEG